MAAAVWLLVALVVGALLWRDRAREIEGAKVAAAATTALMEAHTASTFQAIDLAMRDVARRVAVAPLARHDPTLRDAMRAMLPAMPYVRALFVIGPDGSIQHDTDYPSTPDVSLADRDYFQLHKRDPSIARAISTPLQSRSGAGWFVAATRRIGDGGVFRGIVVAAVQLRYFSELYERVGLSEGHRIVLFHRNGRLLAQSPSAADDVGQTYADYPLFRTHLPQQPRGVYVTVPPAPERVFSYVVVRDEPLVVGLAHDIDHVLVAWRRTAWLAAGALVVLFTLMAGAAALLSRLQEQHRVLRERAMQGEKMEALGLLTGSIAHDFANLLNIVASNLELVRRAGGSEGKAAAAIARAQRAVDGGTELTRRLMSLARKRDLDVSAHDLRDVVSAALPLLEQAAGSGVRIVFEPPPSLPLCRADRSQVEVALINLVVNARDAMGGQGTAQGTVTLRLASLQRVAEGRWLRRPARQAFVELAVQDDGPGMPEDVRRRALEPFFTTKGEAGTGLGLAQVYGLLDQLGGEVAIDSAPGQGTTVRLWFPALESGESVS